MMNGLARFLYAYQDKISDDIFKEKLGEVSIKELTKMARDRRTGVGGRRN